MKTKKLVYTGVFIALGIITPMIFHSVNLGGQIFLPMHIFVFIGGLTLGSTEGLMIGIITPILSSLLTGMPPTLPMLPIMIGELGTYGFVSGYLQEKKNTYASMVTAMVVGRLVAALVVLVLTKVFQFQMAGPFAYITGAISMGMPGILVQIIVIPPLAKIIKKFI